MSKHLRVIIVLLISVIAACGGESEPTSTTKPPPPETTLSFANPFLDVQEEPSNFVAGAQIAVVGRPANDQAWVGSFPADDVEFFGSLWAFDRIDSGLIAIGEAASYQGGPVWERVEKDGKEPGYIPQNQTGVIGASEDITSNVSDLEAASADELLDLVADTIADAEGLEPIKITIREFGGRELFYDLIGGGDPTTRGERLRIVVEESGDVFRVAMVERWIICVSAVTEAGVCG